MIINRILHLPLVHISFSILQYTIYTPIIIQVSDVIVDVHHYVSKSLSPALEQMRSLTFFVGKQLYTLAYLRHDYLIMPANAVFGAKVNALRALHKDAESKSRYNFIYYNTNVGLVSASVV